MAKVTAQMSVSRDGYYAGPQFGLALPDAQSVEDLTALLTSAGER